MPTSTHDRLFPASRDAIEGVETDEGVVVSMTTAPPRVAHADGFASTILVTRWRRGPMHRDDAAALIRITTEIGTDPDRWTPVFEKIEDADRSRPPRGPSKDAGMGQIDFGDLLKP